MSKVGNGPYRPIADYGLIGDMHGVALVSSGGSIDWCAMPHVDSPAFLLRLLDSRRGGAFSVHPTGGPRKGERRYLPATNVLETTWRNEQSVLRLTDAMVPASRPEHPQADAAGRPHQVVRLAECLRGEVQVEAICEVTPDFARQKATAQFAGGKVRWSWAGGEVWLTGSWPLKPRGSAAVSLGVLQQGQSVAWLLSDVDPGDCSPGEARRLLEETAEYWRNWASRCRYGGPYRDPVIRSALALKLLTYEPTGAIVAAATTSLPEEIGGVRNWDYRYCWLRDATFTLHALGLLGYSEEAHDFMHWIQKVCMECGTDLQIMYGVRGERDLTEAFLEHLEGYRGSCPVRVGNQAWLQRQLDVYGEVLDSAYHYFKLWGAQGMYGERATGPVGDLLRGLVDYVAEHWQEKDSGIWEVRGGPQHFLHSKVMCWVALDRGLKLAEEFALPGDRERWRGEREAIRQLVLERGYSQPVGAFTQALGSDCLDASVLLLPLVGFIEARDPRMLSTIAAIERNLMRDGLVYRYVAQDGLPGSEGAFSICTFWLVDCLSMAGDSGKARATFEAMLGRANDLGLYSEEVDPSTGEFLGNFPQAFTHIALINSAVELLRFARG